MVLAESGVYLFNYILYLQALSITWEGIWRVIKYYMFDDSNSNILISSNLFNKVLHTNTPRYTYIYTISNTSIQLGTTCARVLHKISIILSTITKQPSLYYITSLYWIILIDSEFGVKQIAQYQCNVYFLLYMQMIFFY